jgi:2-polyprenyl-3-methyl-5-hydroxy-6-metoxy-1,4-benzoquinol methylase
MPAVDQLLQAGAAVADVGCGAGTAVIQLAQAYPAATFVGFDQHPPNVDTARRAADAAGLADRVRFETRDCAAGLPGRYDIVTAYDVIHDAADPHHLLVEIRRALQPDGRFVCLEINAAETLDGNHGPLGALLYSVSTLYCLTVSLAAGGAGLGTLGLPESAVRDLWQEAGFASVRRVPLDSPFNSLYEAIP